jgi:hypothetical protein
LKRVPNSKDTHKDMRWLQGFIIIPAFPHIGSGIVQPLGDGRRAHACSGT